jgi:hypothetical protein
MAAGVFISFRPEDAAWAARIRDRLQRRLVVWKQNDLGRGVRFANALKTRAGEVEAVVLIIGKNWLAGMVEDPSDRVRVEIEAALGRKIRVIPVLIDGASMPSASALPESLKILARLKPNSDIMRLVETPRHRNIAAAYVPYIKLPFPRSDLGETGLIRIDGPFERKTARKSARSRKAATKSAGKKAAAKKAPARKRVTKTAAPEGAGKKGGARKTAARNSVPKKAAPKGAAKKAAANRPAVEKPAVKKAARPIPAPQAVARGRARIAVNQDLSVDEMKRFAAVRAAEAPSTDPVGDMVECSVFGPPAAPPGKTILIQVFLHLTNQAERASFLASTMDASAKLKATKSLDLPIKRGARVEIAFAANGLEVDDPVQSVVWRGEPTYCQFLATIPAGTSGQGFFPVVRLSIDGKLVGPIKFRLSSDAAASQPASEQLGDHAEPYKYAFVSYATKDRKEVLKRLQMLEVMKTKFFQDILSIEAGDRWKKKLYENIDRCDLFLLFWSQAAKDSEWVIKEAEYALAHQRENPHREPDLVPVVLEQNVPPPPSLSAFQFNDRIGYLISLTP